MITICHRWTLSIEMPTHLLHKSRGSMWRCEMIHATLTSLRVVCESIRVEKQQTNKRIQRLRTDITGSAAFFGASALAFYTVIKCMHTVIHKQLRFDSIRTHSDETCHTCWMPHKPEPTAQLSHWYRNDVIWWRWMWLLATISVALSLAHSDRLHIHVPTY